MTAENDEQLSTILLLSFSSVGPHSQNPAPVQRKTFRAAALCLGVLCLLIIAGTIIIILSIRRKTKRLRAVNMMHFYDNGTATVCL